MSQFDACSTCCVRFLCFIEYSILMVKENLFWSEIVLICSCYCYTLPIYKNTVDRGASRDQSVLFHNYSSFTRWYNNICDFICFISKMFFVHQHQTSSSTFCYKYKKTSNLELYQTNMPMYHSCSKHLYIYNIIFITHLLRTQTTYKFRDSIEASCLSMSENCLMFVTFFTEPHVYYIN